jgi:hypothetical protein
MNRNIYQHSNSCIGQKKWVTNYFVARLIAVSNYKEDIPDQPENSMSTEFGKKALFEKAIE